MECSICSGKAIELGKVESELVVVLDVGAGVHEEWDKSVFVAGDAEDLAFFVDDINSIGCLVHSSNKDIRLTHSRFLDLVTAWNFINIQIPKLRHDIQQSMSMRQVHYHWKVIVGVH